MINRTGSVSNGGRRPSALNFTSVRAAAATSWQPATSGNARRTRLFIDYFFLEKKKHFFFLRPRARVLHNARVYAKNKKTAREKCVGECCEMGKKTITDFAPFRPTFFCRTRARR